MNKTGKYIKYPYWSHEYNSKSIALMKTLKDIYEEMILTWFDDLFQQLKALDNIIQILMLDWQMVTTKLYYKHQI